MQSGIRDAFNICWKLKEVLKGRLADSVLDSYEPERAPDVERYTQIAVALGRVIKMELSAEERAAMQPAPGAEPPPSPLLEAPVLHTGWVTGDTGPTSAVGKYAPQPLAARSNGTLALLDDIIGNGFVLLGDNVDPVTLLDADQRFAWDQLGATYHAVRSADKWSEGPADIVDLEGTLLAWMRGFGAKAIALRPDRFVAASDAGGLTVPSGNK
jgi:3-(3-hydroxy-phenyl)propionate hydroxylase